MAQSSVVQSTSIRIRPGDNVESRVQQILNQLEKAGSHHVITLSNADSPCQKMISILELAKQRISTAAKAPLHQYNKIEYTVSSKPPKRRQPAVAAAAPGNAATGANTSAEPRPLRQQRTEFVYPKLTIKLSRHTLPLTEENGWFYQKVASGA